MTFILTQIFLKIQFMGSNRQLRLMPLANSLKENNNLLHRTVKNFHHNGITTFTACILSFI